MSRVEQIRALRIKIEAYARQAILMQDDPEAVEILQTWIWDAQEQLDSCMGRK